MRRPSLVAPPSPTKSTTTAALTVGQVEHLVDVSTIGDDAVVGADRHRQLGGVGVAINDDQLGGSERLEHLDADVPEPASAEDDAAIARGEPASRLGGDVVGGEAGVGEGGDVGRFERVVEAHDAARRRLEVLGVAAVGVDPGERAGRTVDVVTGATGAAQAAGDQRVDDHLVALGDVGDGRSDAVNPSGVLVADGVRQVDAALLLPLALENVQVGAAHAGATDADDDIERVGGFGNGNLRHLQVLVVADHLDGAHRAHCGTVPRWRTSSEVCAWCTSEPSAPSRRFARSKTRSVIADPPSRRRRRSRSARAASLDRCRR